MVLCSIFFILGMLVGRSQANKIAAAAAAEVSAKSEAKPPVIEEKPELTFYDAVDKNKAQALDLPASKVEPPEVREAVVTQPLENIFNYQVAALRRPSDAEKLLEELKRKGFKSFILAPAPGDPNPFSRVQVGPFSDRIEAESVKKKLEREKYQPILKK